MPDKTIVADKLQKIEESLQQLIDGTANINSVEELLANTEGMLKLKGICMGLLVEAIIAKISSNSLGCGYENERYYCTSLF